MAPRIRRQKYGNSYIAGNARVQLGDRHVTKHITVEKAYIQLQNELGLPDIEALKQALRIELGREDSAGNPAFSQLGFPGRNLAGIIAASTTRAEVSAWDDVCESSPDGEITISEAKRAEQSPTPTSSAVVHSAGIEDTQGTHHSAPRIGNIASQPIDIPSKQTSFLGGTHGRGTTIRDFLVCLARVLSTSRLINVPKLPELQHSALNATNQTDLMNCDGSLVNSSSHACATNDISMLATGIVSYILGQNVSVKDISDLLIMFQEHQILGLLTCLLGIGLYRYFMTRRLTIAPSSSDKLTLEDAYGRPRSFSLEICADFDLLTKFLHVHYLDTAGATAGTLVKAGQFYMMLGSRRGRAFSRRNWSKIVLKPGYRLVNSVYIQKDSAECLSCQVTMTITAMGEFHCPSCGAYHRDCDTFTSSVTVVPERCGNDDSDAPPTPMHATANNVVAHSSKSSSPRPIPSNRRDDDNMTRENVLEDIKYDTHDLINLDLKFRPQKLDEVIFLDLAEVVSTPLYRRKLDVLAVEQGQFVTILSKGDLYLSWNGQLHLCEDHLGGQGYVPQAHLYISWNGQLHLCEDRLGGQGYVPQAHLKIISRSAVRFARTDWAATIVRFAYSSTERPELPSLEAGTANESRSRRSKSIAEGEDAMFDYESNLKDKGFLWRSSGSLMVYELASAAGMGNLKKVQALLSLGIDINECVRGPADEIGTTPLIAACSSNHSEIVQLLVDHGADVHARGMDREYALNVACEKGNVQIIRILLDAGANVNAQGAFYGSALQAAAAWGLNIDAVHMLLDAGADPNFPGGYYGNALQTACANGGGDLTVQMLLDAGADVDARGGHYGGALQAACARSSSQVVQVLIDAGADINSRGGYHGSPLRAALFRGNEDITQLLLQRGAVNMDTMTART